MLYLCSSPPSRLCLDLYLPFCLALLYFYLLWLLRLSLPYLTPAAQYDSAAIIISDLFGLVRELGKNITVFLRFDQIRQIRPIPVRILPLLTPHPHQRLQQRRSGAAVLALGA